MARKITTVTHPDGTVSRRTSASAVYAFAVQVKRDMRADAASLRETAASADARADRLAIAAETGDVNETRGPWSFGGEYVKVFVGGEYASAYVTPKDEPITEAAARDMLRGAAESARRSAAVYRTRAAVLDAGPEFTYAVTRWSRTAALAEKGLREVHLHGRDEVRVVPVD